MDIKKVLQRFKTARTDRAIYDTRYELVARYVRFRKYSFVTDYQLGGFVTHGDVYDSTANRACHIAASAINGALWKNGARTFRLVRPKYIPENEEVKAYYEELNERVVGAMEDPRAGFEIALDEYMQDQLSFGTSGIAAFKGEGESLIDFKCWDIKGLFLEEDHNGKVYALFYVRKLNAMQIALEYGEENLTQKMQACYAGNDATTKFEVVTFIGPRTGYDPEKKDVKNKPFASMHIAVADEHLLRESGYDELPCKVARFFKNVEEKLGRSPAMEALPDIIELNAVVEMLHKAAEKNIFPPLAVLDDGTFGGGTIDLSPMAVNVLNISQRITTSQPIFPIGTTGELQSTIKLKEMLEQSVMQHFFLDRLIDLNNDTRMTLGEAQIRNEIRADAMGGTYSRQMNEMFTPLIGRVVNLLWEMGVLGVANGSPEEAAIIARGDEPLYIPKEVADAISAGRDFYRIEYISPAARIMRSEELRGLSTSLGFAANYAPMFPELMMLYDAEKVGRKVNELSGATDDIFVAKEVFDERVKAHQETQAQVGALQAALQNATIRKTNAGAMQSETQAQATMQGAMG